MTIPRYELTEVDLARARSYAASEPWGEPSALPRVLSETAALLRRHPHAELVLVTAPSIAPGVEIAVPEDWFYISQTGPPRSVRVLLAACVITMWAAFRINAEDPMNTTGQVIEMALDLLAGNAFPQMIHLLRQNSNEGDE